ncbi:MAG TPA: (d)CMP kinase [Smithella sp.]|nr:(d)CMP kinase [Smithella sp.]MDM7986127.1 (d)CMP kinase [Smithella sp.]HNY48977.1 (d)CMP kinase [Smithella sp.]HOG89061.1 (d)CMP kinase [Smithella sp.]HOU50973.1 (d)CMP kinase [Smithella sp.]
MGKKPIITIDGPAGAGKSTISKILAKKFNYIYLDTGALYRALAYKALKTGISIDDPASLENLCANTEVYLKNVHGQMKVYVDGEDVERKIRTEEVGLTASKISTFPIVREKLLDLQREAGVRGGLVAEGRDMGSVVFPKADYKFYLDASLDERTKRRHKELLLKNDAAGYASIKKDMQARDKQDSQRAIAPLKAPEGAILIDSDNLSIEGVVDKIISNISKK